MPLPENGPKASKRKFHLKQPLLFLWGEVLVLGRVTFKTEGLEDSIFSFHSNFGYNEFSGIPNARYFWYRSVPDGIPPKAGSMGKPLTFGLVFV